MYKPDAALRTLLAPARQPFVGPACDHDPIGSGSLRVGQINPDIANEMNMEHGRYLSGMGNVEEMAASNIDPDPTTTGELATLEEMDDVYGSGIFDDTQRDGTANVDAGVFETHNSLPGYLAREKWFRESPEVVSLPNNAPVVVVPAGGFSLIDRTLQQRAPDAPQYSPPNAPGRQNVYAYLEKHLDLSSAGDVQPSGKESIPQPVRRGYRDSPHAFVWEDDLPGTVKPKTFQRTAMVPSSRPPQPVPYQRRQLLVPSVSTVQPVVATAPVSLSGLSTTTNLLAWGAVGAIAGVALSYLLK